MTGTLAEAADEPPKPPDTLDEVFGATFELFEFVDDAGAVEAPNEKDGVDAGLPKEGVDELAAGAAGLAEPKPEKPPNGLVFGCDCEVVLELVAGAAGAPKLNVGVEVVGAVDEGALPNPPAPPRVAKGLVPPDAPNDGDGAAPNDGVPAAAAPGVPGVPFRFGSPRITLPPVGVAGIEPCEDGDSSSDPSSPSSRRICFSA